MSERIYISVDQGSHGGLQLSINVECCPDGGGRGYRIFGPKYDGGSKQLKRHYLTDRDVDEIRSYLKRASASALPDDRLVQPQSLGCGEPALARPQEGAEVTRRGQS
jgi:hypothetical protein